MLKEIISSPSTAPLKSTQWEASLHFELDVVSLQQNFSRVSTKSFAHGLRFLKRKGSTSQLQSSLVRSTLSTSTTFIEHFKAAASPSCVRRGARNFGRKDSLRLRSDLERNGRVMCECNMLVELRP
jgi:hypothetical protein